MSWFTSHNKKLLLSLGFFLASLVFLPQTALACLSTTAGGGGGHVWYINCAETQDTGGAGNIGLPTGTQAGDVLILTIIIDGNITITTAPAATNITWTQVNSGLDNDQNNAVSYFIFRGMVTGAPGTLSVTMPGGNDWLATVMRVSGSTGNYDFTTNTGAIETFAPAPAITTTVNESLIFRMGGFDDDDYTTRDAAGLMAGGHTTISQFETTNAADSAAHAYIYRAVAGTQAAQDFATIPSAVEDWRTASMALQPFYMCDGSTAVFSAVPVQYEGCAETGVYGNNTSLTLSSPTNTGFYDYLVAVVTVDGNQDITAPGGWTQIGSDVIANGSASRMEIFGRQFSAGSPQNYNFTWGANEAAFGYIMRFTGTQGFDVAGTPSTSTAANPTTPGLTTTVDNSLLVRLGVFDNTPIQTNPTTILTGQGGRISLGRSSGDPANSVASGAAWFNQPAAGVVGTVAFTGIAAEDSGNQTLSLPPVSLCTGTNGVASGGTVEYAGCEQRTANEVTSITVPTPSGTAIGDYLLAVVATDDDTSATIAPPAGWTTIDEGASNTDTATLAVYGRFADAAGTQNHSFSWTGTQNAFAYIMRYTNTLGVDPADVAFATGSGTSVATAAITTAVANTMVVRIGAFEGASVKWHPTDIANIVTGLSTDNNVTQGRSTANPTTAVSSAAAWVNQAGTGTSGTPTFNGAPTSSVPTRRVTVGLRPTSAHFRISHGGSATLCAQPSITITAYNANGSINTGYTGTVQLSTSTSQGYWGIGDGDGVLTGGGVGDGTATYVFNASDLGVVSLQYAGTALGALNFNLTDGSISEHPAYDASLTITTCNLGVPLQQQCANALTTPTITIPSNTTPSSNRLVIVTTSRSGAVANTAGAPAGTATFNGAAMTQVGASSWIDSASADSMTQIFMMSQSTTPALPVGGTYSATMASSTAGFERICVFYYEDVAQTVPTGTAVALTNATVAGTTTTTNITPPAANSLVISAVTGTAELGSFPNATAPLTNRLQNVNGTASTFAVSSGIVSPPAVNIVETSAASITRRTHNVAAFAPAAAQLDHFRISHAGTGDNCTPNDITITAIDQYGNVFTGYTGTVNLTAEGVGDWTETTANGTLQNLTADDGIATYAFVGGDAGIVTLQYTDYTADSAKNFNVSDSVTPAIDEHNFFDPNLNMVQCTFRITLPSSTGSICAANAVTIGIYDAQGNLGVDYEGEVTLTAGIPSPSNSGDWYVGTGLGDPALGTLANGAANDGVATYTFHTNDNGLVTFGYERVNTATVNFDVSGGGMGGVAGGFDPNLTVGTCYFRVDHDDDGDSTGDVCTPEAVKITIVNSSGVTQTGYTGTLNLETSTDVGDWSKQGSQTGFSNSGSGVASYTFQPGDNGEVILYLMHHSTSGGVSIDPSANGGAITVDPGPGFDPPMAVSACTIRFTLSSPNATACTAVTVTMGVYNSAGTLATSYAGDVALTTSTSHGTWLSENGAGSILDTTPGNGTGTYTFVAGDLGDAQIKFTSSDIEDLNFNATANGGAITVDTGQASYDPSLNVTSCLPVITADACYANASQADAITLPSSVDSLASRMVLVYIGSASNVDAGTVTFEGASQAPTFLRTETVGTGLKLHVYGILDTYLPAAAGSYDVSFTGSSAPAMCIVAVTGVGQTLPAEDSPPADGQLNGTGLTSANPISTGVTTLQNNSIVIGVTINSQGGTSYESTQTTELWATGAADPTGADWAGHSSYQLPAASVLVTTTASVVPNRQAQILVTLAPFVIGPPASAGYVPVTLFETFSGNVNYRAVGNTLRVAANGSFACLMQGETTGSQATMTLPPGATIEAAYLYWAGSGYENAADDDVMFGPVGDQDPITADEVFIIDPDQVYNPDYEAVPEGFFAAYKDVTGLVTAATPTTYHFSHLTVNTGPPWSTYSTCMGGWSLVIVFEDTDEPLNVINLFHGFQPFWHSAFTLVPRNFRMATPDGATTPHGQVTHITFEGDPDITGVEEVLELQNNPAALTFDILTNTANPNNNQYNSTTSFPNYNALNVFQNSYTTSAVSYGTDVDTFYVEGDTNGEHIYPFGSLESEQITTRYSTDQDIVLLVGEFISVTNAPIADLEVTVTDSGTWKVGASGTGVYSYDVKNNGNGAATGGHASGDVILTGNMPAGITIASITANGWDCLLTTSTAFTCVFEIVGDWTIGVGATTNGQLKQGENLPDLVVTVNIGTDAVFPLLDNEIETVARMAAVGDYYLPNCQGQGAAAGVQPNPNPSGGCSKPPQFDNVNDLNKYLIDIDNLDEKTSINNNVHSKTRNVRGVETKLAINKTVTGILQINEPAVYNLSVSNTGPDATTKTITVTDTLPSGLVPLTAVGTGWVCNIVTQDVTCTRAASLGIGATAPAISITTGDISSPVVEGATVNNSATVTPGTYNFDTDTTSGNPNTDTDSTVVTGAPAAATEKFLVSVTEDGSTLGGLLFDEGDIALYDPVANTATMFLDESSIPTTTNLGDIDALHVLPNGHILLSTDTDGATIVDVTFNAEDLVLYDPLLRTATLVFDGSTIFLSATSDIDAVHVLYNNSYTPADWDIILSTTDTATIGALTFQDNDVVSFDMSPAGVATLLEDGAGNDLFNGAAGDISALYLRYDDVDKYILSTSDASATIGNSVPLETLGYERGEVIEIDLSTPGAPVTTPLLCDNVLPCTGSPAVIVTPASATRRIDAVHMIETGYFGHFAIISAGGDACSATTITIRKHAGLTHTVDPNYGGSIRISNNLALGTWAKDATADGTLYTSGYGLGAGEAIYTFAAGASADNGEVILYITGVGATNNLNVSVTNGMAAESSPAEDPTITISDQVTQLTYRDEFSTVAYNNNDGVAGFASVWAETNDDGSASTGKVRVDSGTSRLRFNNLGGGQPSLMREIDFSAYTVDEPPVLSFDWTISGNPSGTFVVEVSNNNGSSWTTLQSFTASTGSGTALYSFSGAPWNVTPSADTQIQFRIASGYSSNSNEVFFVDNVNVATETHDCGVGNAIDHYAITHTGTMVSCLAQMITITPHTVGELAIEPTPGTIISLNTSTAKGYWGPPTNGTLANFNGNGGNNGFATYTYAAGEDDLTFPFYYPEMTTDTTVPAVNITVVDTSVPIKSNSLGESQNLTVSRTGLRFVNERVGTYPNFSTTYPTLVAGMPSKLYKNDIMVVQAIRTSPVDPLVCEPLFDADGTDVEIELAFECKNPADCSAAVLPVYVTNSSGTPVAVEPVTDNGVSAGAATGGYTPVTLHFSNANLGTCGDGTGGCPTNYSRAELKLNSSDVGQFQIHGQHNINYLNDANTLQDSNFYMSGSGPTFVVRPFAFDIDIRHDPDGNGPTAPLPADRMTNGNDDGAISWAEDAGDSAFLTAGENFITVVRAVAWECVDDDPTANCTTLTGTFDGVPHQNADLFDDASPTTGNWTTQNFGKEASPAQEIVNITRTKVAPVSGVDGVLSGGGLFVDFVNGENTQELSYDEVGIINLHAALNTADYLGSGETVGGRLNNVGRFIPKDFQISTTMLTPRNQIPGASSSVFNYMEEDFGVAFTLTARNKQGAITKNYTDTFAKMQAGDISFYAIQDRVDNPTPAENNDIDYSSRLEVSTALIFTGGWGADGIIDLFADLHFTRQGGGAPDGPYPAVTIAMTVSDDDAVTDFGDDRDVDDDDGTTQPGPDIYRRIGSTTLDFRYGRLRLENAYGPEIPDLDENEDPIGRDVQVMLTAEYWDGANFIPNAQDLHTPYASAALGFVPDSYNLDGEYPEPLNLDTGEALITSGITGKIYQGGAYGITTPTVTDSPLFLQAPGPNNSGTVLIELDLGADFNGTLPGVQNLNFLKFDWRDGSATGADVEADIKADPNNFSAPDNPRAIVEFGTFRGNDRIINWQEIFE